MLFLVHNYTSQYQNILDSIQHVMKIPNKRENHSSDINFKYFMKIYNKYTAEQYSFLVKDTTLPLGNLVRFKQSLLEMM